MKTQIHYRVWQFLQSLKKAPSPSEQQKAVAYLSPAQELLFQGMSSADQNHSIRVFDTLINQNAEIPDLLVAGLLHDIGKQKVPLRRWERVFVVLMKAAVPQMINSWGEGSPSGWKRSLVVSRCHAAWGAEMARTAGCTPLTVWLIENHENKTLPSPPSPEAAELLRTLQFADNQN